MISEHKKEAHFETLDLKTTRIAVVTSQFNAEITEKMRMGAENSFLELGGKKEHIQFYKVPGSLELPVVAKKLAKTQHYDAILCIGCVIKGETAHFDYVCSSTIQGLVQASLDTEIPILNAVITAYTYEQAQRRACEDLNLGRDHLISALQTVETIQQIK